MQQVDILFTNAHVLSMDEIREGGTCEACRGRNMGQLLGETLTRQFNLFREVNPKVDVWVWSDMLDPNHNAKKDYYLVRGDHANPEYRIAEASGERLRRRRGGLPGRGRERARPAEREPHLRRRGARLRRPRLRLRHRGRRDRTRGARPDRRLTLASGHAVRFARKLASSVSVPET